MSSWDIEFTKRVIEAYNSKARTYDAWYEKFKLIFESELNTIRSFNFSGLGLEIGVGTGLTASRLDIKIGLDPSIRMLERAFKRKIWCIQAIGERIPIKNSALDFVLLNATLCFLSNPLLVFQEVKRILKPKGQLIICIIPRDSPWGSYYIQKGKEGHTIFKHARFYNLKEVKKLLSLLEFKIIDIKGTLTAKPNQEPIKEGFTYNLERCSYICINAIKLQKFFS